MNPTTQHQLMLKIVAGSAWADGHLEPQELAYLGSLLRRYGLEHDTELREVNYPTLTFAVQGGLKASGPLARTVALQLASQPRASGVVYSTPNRPLPVP